MKGERARHVDATSTASTASLEPLTEFKVRFDRTCVELTPSAHAMQLNWLGEESFLWRVTPSFASLTVESSQKHDRQAYLRPTTSLENEPRGFLIRISGGDSERVRESSLTLQLRTGTPGLKQMYRSSMSVCSAFALNKSPVLRECTRRKNRQGRQPRWGRCRVIIVLCRFSLSESYSSCGSVARPRGFRLPHHPMSRTCVRASQDR